MRRSARWLVPGLLLLACTPRPVDAPHVEADTAVTAPPRCGGLTIAPRGPWIERDDPRLAWLEANWHPRGEYGRPKAFREAQPPVSFEHRTFVEVRVAQGPLPTVHCYVPNRPGEGLASACEGAESVVELLHGPGAVSRPRDARAWAELLGALDGAVAVYESAEIWSRCAFGPRPVPPPHLADLGVRGPVGSERVAFVALFEPSAELALLVKVTATAEGEFMKIEREELWTHDRRAQ